MSPEGHSASDMTILALCRRKARTSKEYSTATANPRSTSRRRVATSVTKKIDCIRQIFLLNSLSHCNFSSNTYCVNKRNVPQSFHFQHWLHHTNQRDHDNGSQTRPRKWLQKRADHQENEENNQGRDETDELQKNAVSAKNWFAVFL